MSQSLQGLFAKVGRPWRVFSNMKGVIYNAPCWSNVPANSIDCPHEMQIEKRALVLNRNSKTVVHLQDNGYDFILV